MINGLMMPKDLLKLLGLELKGADMMRIEIQPLVHDEPVKVVIYATLSLTPETYVNIQLDGKQIVKSVVKAMANNKEVER